MRIALEPLRQLHAATAESADGSSVWESIGDDPGFLIPLRFLRHRHLVIILDGADEDLDPRLYMNHGLGFHEGDSFGVGSAKRHILVVDIGLIGTVRSIRLDPSTFPVTFTCEAESFATRNAADRRARAYLASAPDAILTHFAQLNRLRLPGPSWFRALRRLSVGDHSAALYALAADMPAPAMAKAGECWLSLVVPVFNASARHLDDLLKSFEAQDVRGVELVISDDGSTSRETIRMLDGLHRRRHVKVVRSAVNRGIAISTNAGLEAAAGSWIGFVDHDDLLAPHALKVVGNALLEHPDANFFYTDEMLVDDRLKAIGYMLKPAYDPVLLSGVNFINHLSVYRRSRLDELGLMRGGLDGSQDYDLALRYLAGLGDHEIVHIPYPAYWWRRTGKTFSRKFMGQATENARKALADAYSAPEHGVVVKEALTPTLHRVIFNTPSPQPKISIVVPNRNAFRLIDRVLSDLYGRTAYPNLEVIVVDNGSTDGAVLALYERMKRDHPNFTALLSTEAFNFARSVDRGIAQATGEHFLLLNNDVEVIEPGWLAEMVSCLSYRDAGIVGAKLLFPDDTIQHAGVVAGFGGLAGHWYLNKPRDFGGPMNRLHVRASMTCVTAAAMLISGQCRQAVGRFDETNFAIAYNDVDYCLRAYKAGFRSVWTPFACLYHHESASRGSDATRQNRARFEQEKANLRRIHATTEFVDPATSPYSSRTYSTPILVRPQAIAPTRNWFPRQVVPDV